MEVTENQSDETNKTNKVIGIDLGTTYSCVGVMKEDGHVEIIANEHGHRTTPSYVFFTDNGQRIIGQEAKNLSAKNPSCAVFDTKRLLGKNFSDKEVTEDIKNYPFKVTSKNDKPVITIKTSQGSQTFEPEQISAMILEKMKSIAEKYLGHEVKDAVITVPAYFNDAQRQATKIAGSIAGLNVIRIINEPTSASLAYGLHKKFSKDTNVLVFDLGGGTLDVSLLTLSGKIFEVIATSGNTHLGGEDFDTLMVNYFKDKFFQKYGIDISKNLKAIRKLKTQCEIAKKSLSELMEAEIDIDSLAEGQDFTEKISLQTFNNLCENLFQSCLEPVEKVLVDAKMKKSQIHEIVLVGGSSRIKRIKELLREYFGRQDLCESINPDEAVAYGAAVQGAILAGDKSEVLNNVLLVDVIPLTLGVETAGGILTPILSRNTTIPTEGVASFTTHEDNQPGVTIKIFQGERKFTRDCELLGVFTMEGIPLMPKGVPVIEVKFEVDANGILTVTAEEKVTGKKSHIKVENRNSFSQEDIDNMIAVAEKFRNEDLKNFERIEIKNSFEVYVYSWRNQLLVKEFSEKLAKNDLVNLTKAIQDAKTWLETHPNELAETYTLMRSECEKIVTPILMSLSGNITDKSNDSHNDSQNNSQNNLQNDSQSDNIDQVTAKHK